MKKYWKSLEELKQSGKSEIGSADTTHKNDFLEIFDEGSSDNRSSRRDFLKLCGFSFATATVISACERPVQKAIPYLIKPEEVTPGKASHYATTFIDGEEYCPLVVKVRDGRPIKIEGNPDSEITGGGTTARVQASVLNLYDDARYKEPMSGGKEISWEQADEEILTQLNEINGEGKQIALLTSTILSPTTKKSIDAFASKFDKLKWVQYDAISFSAILNANQESFGKSVIPSYRFDKADIIIGFGADFLGTWLSPVEFIKQYTSRRRIDNDNLNMSRHIQFEAGMSVTGSNADFRVPIRPSEEGAVLAAIYNQLAEKIGLSQHDAPAASIPVTEIAEELWRNKGRALVVSGSNEKSIQLLVNGINSILDSYGNTIFPSDPMYIRNGIDADMFTLLEDMESGRVGAIFVYQANPVYNYPYAERFKKALNTIFLSVSMASVPDETSSICQYVCPDHHYLESWNDAQPRENLYNLAQPLINPLFNTRQAQQSFLKWTGVERVYRDYLIDSWQQDVYPLHGSGLNFKSFWEQHLQKGFFTIRKAPVEDLVYAENGLAEAIASIQSPLDELELALYENVGVGSGKYANNPWLQELPDAITKVSWDNYAALSPAQAAELGLEDEDLIYLNETTPLPVLIQPGQAYGTVSVALGYGRAISGKVGDDIGSNLYSLVGINESGERAMSKMVNLKTSDMKYELARTQTHHSMEGRPIIRETTLKEYLENPYAGNEFHLKAEEHKVTLYDEVKFDGHHWGLVIDLNACVACNNCVIACQSENNVAVVGKDEVRRRRIMHWLRIDRYYSGDPENPMVHHQPVMCQHCDNAPCENVCPVSATMHSEEGLNQIAYNRCIGTKYCINNCPYRVRRFNWFRYVKNPEFDFNLNSDLGRMVLNPDVTVRARGVVEKCTLCVQRIQEKKMEAKSENRILSDGEIEPACVQSCPANALVFGDLNDKESRVYRLMNRERNYHLLEELHTLPSVGYLTKVRNRKA